MTTSAPAPLPGLNALQPAERARPAHYLMFSYELPDLEDNEIDGMRVPEDIYVVDAFDYDPPLDGYDEDEAIWDNWSGEWVVARPWVWQFDVTAEGFARYDLRPAA